MSLRWARGSPLDYRALRGFAGGTCGNGQKVRFEAAIQIIKGLQGRGERERQRLTQSSRGGRDKAGMAGQIKKPANTKHILG
jgi:hypothetical protein